MAHLLTVPKLVIAQRVIEKMVQAAGQFIADETGEAMIGLITPGKMTSETTVYIVDTIAPDVNAPDVDTVREAYAFKQGGEHQYEVFTWLVDNWQSQRDKRKKSYGRAQKAKWDVTVEGLPEGGFKLTMKK